jgi:hypothetical protein
MIGVVCGLIVAQITQNIQRGAAATKKAKKTERNRDWRE